MRSTAARRAGSGLSAGSGTRPVMGRASCGLVPQVTVGASAEASNATSASKAALSSVGSVCQKATASSQRAPAGAKGRPSRKA